MPGSPPTAAAASPLQPTSASELKAWFAVIEPAIRGAATLAALGKSAFGAVEREAGGTALFLRTRSIRAVNTYDRSAARRGDREPMSARIWHHALMALCLDLSPSAANFKRFCALLHLPAGDDAALLEALRARVHEAAKSAPAPDRRGALLQRLGQQAERQRTMQRSAALDRARGAQAPLPPPATPATVDAPGAPLPAPMAMGAAGQERPRALPSGALNHELNAMFAIIEPAIGNARTLAGLRQNALEAVRGAHLISGNITKLRSALQSSVVQHKNRARTFTLRMQDRALMLVCLGQNDPRRDPWQFARMLGLPEQDGPALADEVRRRVREAVADALPGPTAAARLRLLGQAGPQQPPPAFVPALARARTAPGAQMAALTPPGPPGCRDAPASLASAGPSPFAINALLSPEPPGVGARWAPPAASAAPLAVQSGAPVRKAAGPSP